MSEWQPIETAPKETPVLIAAHEWKDGPRIICVAEQFHLWGRDDPRVRWRVLGVSGFECENDFETPTHWMPLPEPPK